jgi:hypothetical protein
MADASTACVRASSSQEEVARAPTLLKLLVLTQLQDVTHNHIPFVIELTLPSGKNHVQHFAKISCRMANAVVVQVLL